MTTTAANFSNMSSLDDTLTINNMSSSGAISINNSSNYYKQQQQPHQQPSTPTSSSFTAMLAAAAAAVSTSPFGNNEKEDYDDYELKNKLNIINNIHNLTDDDDEGGDEGDFIRHQFHFNESFELDEENVMMFNSNSKTSPLQQQRIKTNKCSFQKCFFNNNKDCK